MTGPQLALEYEAFSAHLEGPVVYTGESIIDRQPVDTWFGYWLEGCKHLRDQGWDVTVLLARDEKTAVMVACR